MTYSPCWLAGICICSGDGVAINQLRKSFIGKYFSNSPYAANVRKSIMDNGFTVLCLSGVAVHEDEEGEASGSEGGNAEEVVARLWLHLSFTYGKVERPTFWQMHGPGPALAPD